MAHWFHTSGGEHSASRFFDGIGAIQAHLDQRSRVEDYVNGDSREKPDVSTCCHADCMLGRWLHSEHGVLIQDAGLLDSLFMCCRSCEEFLDAAAQAVLLTDMGESESARASLGADQLFNDASVAFQKGLAELHVAIQGL